MRPSTHFAQLLTGSDDTGDATPAPTNEDASTDDEESRQGGRVTPTNPLAASWDSLRELTRTVR